MSSTSNIPKRYWWVAAGAVATAGVLFIKNKLDRKDEPPRRERPMRDDGPPSSTPSSSSASGEASSSTPLGAAKELHNFLAGETWHDEAGWRGIWEREGVVEPASWLKEIGTSVLRERRAALKDHPALLAGCRRRWIVVCRYGAVDVTEAAELWNQTDRER